MHHDSLENFQFCSFVTTLLTNSVHASRSSGRIFQLYPFITILLTTFVHTSRSSGRIFNVVHATHSSERVLDDQRNRRLDEAAPKGNNHDLSSSTTGTQLHVFVWRNSGSGPRYLVCVSLALSSPDILDTRIFPDRTWCYTHKSPTDKCQTFPSPSRWTILIAAVASDLIAT